jgi:hypothetical protein
MVFVALSSMVVMSVMISRQLVVKSQSEVFGSMWARAVLAEYDRNLFDEYGLLAYQGLDSDVDRKLEFYQSYSMSGGLSASIEGASSDLTEFRMNDPANFRKAMKDSFAAEAADSVLSSKKRIERTDRSGEPRRIGNRVVLHTLPSGGISSTIDVDHVTEQLRNGRLLEMAKETGKGTAVEILFIKKYLPNYMTYVEKDDTFLKNEWEYIVRGSPDDEVNFKACRRRIFLIRNALNLASLLKDPQKMELITSVSQAVMPGPGGAVIQAALTEGWAALEAKHDVDELIDGGRVPLIKTPETWETDLGMLLDSDELAGKLDDEAAEQLKKKRKKGDLEEFEEASSGNPAEEAAEGQNYEDYIMFLVLSTDEQLRLLRIMDLVQIDMKYRYYDDFDLGEYNCGVKFRVKANGRRYEIKDVYK